MIDEHDKLKLMRAVLNYANMTTRKSDEEVYYVLGGFISDLQKIHDQMGKVGEEDESLKTRVKILCDARRLCNELSEWLDEEDD